MVGLSGDGGVYGDGCGYGCGYGYGYGVYGGGCGYGDGYGGVYGGGSGSGSGFGYGDGYGGVYGGGSGSGSGCGYGDDYGYGDGSGYGLGYGDGGYSGSGGYGFGGGSGCGYGPQEYWAAAAQNLDTRGEPSGRLAFWRTKKCGGSVHGEDLPGVVEGAIHVETGPLALCSPGTLHATLNPDKWTGERVWLVALHGQVIEGKDKLGCLKREIIREVNIGV